MTKHFVPYHLLEEARKSWEYLVTDELVYVLQGRRNPGVAGFSYLEGYLAGFYWIELAIRIGEGGHNHDFIAIIEHAYRAAKKGHFDMKDMPEDRGIPVGVGIPPIIEQKQGVHLGSISSVIRLKALDDLDFRAVGIRYQRKSGTPSTNIGLRRRFFFEDWERGSFIWNSPIPGCQGPSNLVKSGAETVDELTNEHTNPGRGFTTYLEPRHIVGSLRLLLDHNGVGLQQVVNTQCTINGVEMLLRPFESEPWPIEWVHRQDSTEQPPASQSRKDNNEQ